MYQEEIELAEILGDVYHLNVDTQFNYPFVVDDYGVCLEKFLRGDYLKSCLKITLSRKHFSDNLYYFRIFIRWTNGQDIPQEWFESIWTRNNREIVTFLKEDKDLYTLYLFKEAKVVIENKP